MIKESDRISFFKYSTGYINILSLIISVILFLIIQLCCSYFDFQPQNTVFKAGFAVNSDSKNNIESINVIQQNNENVQEKNDWYLEIPGIKLSAGIVEGTNEEVLEKFIGHFEETKKWIGNVCLAAHNRGYENNYFAEAKSLKEGDKIIYHYKGSSREYIVEKNYIIPDTDLLCLEDTEDNTITLITCVENEPNYRRCVKAIENKE